MDLKRLGKLLRERREALRLPRARLARQVGVSPGYLWLIEEAKPRPGGPPSRPNRGLLLQLAHELVMTPTERDALLALAGFDLSTEDINAGVDVPAILSARATDSGRPAALRYESQLAIALRALQKLLPDSIDLAVRLGEVFDTPPGKGPQVFTPTDPARSLLALMDEQDFSQVIVRADDHLRLVTDAGVIAWLLKCATTPASSLDEATAATLLQAEGSDRAVVLSAEHTLLDAINEFRKSWFLYAIILTPSGDEAEEPFAVVTAWDLVNPGRSPLDEEHAAVD